MPGSRRGGPPPPRFMLVSELRKSAVTHRHREPEGRRRQDHDGGQPCRLPGGVRRGGAAHRSRSSGQRVRRAGRPPSTRRGRRTGCWPARSASMRPCADCRRRTMAPALMPGPRRRRGGAGRRGRQRFVLERAIRGPLNAYDYVFIDCSPSLGVLTVNALAAAREVLVPVQAEYYALEGLAQLLETIELVRERLNPQLRILGVLIHHARRTHTAGPGGRQRDAPRTSARTCSRPPCRATCGSAKHRATACRSTI